MTENKKLDDAIKVAEAFLGSAGKAFMVMDELVKAKPDLSYDADDASFLLASAFEAGYTIALHVLGLEETEGGLVAREPAAA